MKIQSPYAIETCGLTKSFPKLKRYRELLLHPFRQEWITALRGVDLQVGHNELFGLLGPNGAGKTTLIKILCTLMLPNEGWAKVNGYDIFQQGKQIRRTIGYVVSEERSFYWRISGRQNLEFFATLNNLSPAYAKQHINKVLEITGLGQDADKLFKDYSTGMRQRLAVARALLTDPDILFMDEPTRSLDPTSAQHLRDFVLEEIIQCRGKTVFLSTHNMAEAQLCHRIAILHKGRIKACGTVEQLRGLTSDKRYLIKLHQNGFNYREVMLSLPFVKHAAELKSEPHSPYLQLEVSIDEQRGSVWQLIEQVVGTGGRLEACQPLEGSLEEVFSRLTAED
jgi:ABC-2 type transport system ATP-binding protein